MVLNERVVAQVRTVVKNRTAVFVRTVVNLSYMIINLAMATCTRATTRTVWNQGKLEIVPINTPAMADGALSVADAETNKCTCVKANPADTTNIAKGGDAASVLSVVDDSAELALIGLDNVCAGNVYKMDNSAGSGDSWAIISGQAGNTNKHSISSYARRTGSDLSYMAISGMDATTKQIITADNYTQYTSEDITPTDTIKQMAFVVVAGDVVYFILPQLEESAVATPVIIGADTAASATRDADINTVPTPNVLTPESGAIRMRITPTAEDQITKYFWASVVNNDDLFGIYSTATQVIGLHKIDALNEFAVDLYTMQIGVDSYIDMYWEADGTFGIRGFAVGDAEPAFATNSGHNTFPLASTLAIGHKSDVSQFIGEYANNGQPICYASKEAAGWS